MISIESVTKHYGSFVAVKDVSFEVKRDEIVGFVGPNGAGKSTILKMLSTYLQPTRGRITVDGLDVTRHSLDVRRKIGYLAGDTPLYQGMRVDQFLYFVGRARELRGAYLKERFDWAVDTLHLKDVLTKRVNQCSTGFRQRIGLATALIHDPSIIILDEPTHGFDPLQVLAFRDLLRSLSPNRAILFSSHIIQDVASISHRVVMINQGTLLGNGTLSEIAQQLGRKKIDLEEMFVELIRQSEPAGE